MLKNKFFQLSNSLNYYIKNKQIDELKNAIFDVFVKNDIPYGYAKKLVDKIELYINNIKNDKKNKKTISGFITEYIINDFKKNIKKLKLQQNKTNVIGIFGLNGVGKTSFIAKLANYLNKKHHKSIICISLDNQRPTGKEQLRNLCTQIGVKYLYVKTIADGLKIITSVVSNYTADVLLVDTAGINPKNNTNIRYLINIMNNIVFDEKILVVDGTSGQNTVSVLKLFCKYIKPTGVVVSKTETDKKSGVFFFVKTAIKAPIYFVTKGEKIDDIYIFDERYIHWFFLKKTHIVCDVFLQQNVVGNFQKKYQQDKLNYNSLQQHLSDLIKKDVFSKIKSFYSKNVAVCNAKMTTETYMLIKKWIAIIQSMTKNERLCLCRLNVLRINRIAKGAGVSASDVIGLKKKLEEINEKS